MVYLSCIIAGTRHLWTEWHRMYNRYELIVRKTTWHRMPTSQEDDFRLTPTPTKAKQHTPKDAECLFRATWTPVTRIYFTLENPYSTTLRWLNVSGPTLTNLNVSSFYSKELLPGNWHRPSFSVLTPRILHVLDRAVNRTSWSRWSKEQPQVLTKILQKRNMRQIKLTQAYSLKYVLDSNSSYNACKRPQNCTMENPHKNLQQTDK